MLTIQQLFKLSPRDFEMLCCSYVQTKYGNSANVKLTPPQGDGGKDIEIELIPSHILHWGECKLHNRNLDLSSIGKNVVLVLSLNIRKLIFFSLTDIVYNTKKHIINLAKTNNFDVVFLDGENLLFEFAHYKIIEGHQENEDKLYSVEIFAEEFTESENALNYSITTKNSNFSLKSVNKFSFVLLIKNRSCKRYMAKISTSSDDKRFKVNINHNKIKILPFSDTIKEISVDTNIKFGESIKLPDININVNGNTEVYTTGKITSDFYSEVVLLGQDIYNCLYEIKKGFNEDRFNIVEIVGRSGIGKSRLVNEILNCNKEAKSFIFQECSIEAETILTLISFVINFPINYSEKMDIKVLKSVLASKNQNEAICDLIARYYSNPNSLKTEELSILFNFIINQLINKSEKQKVILAFENITVLPTNTLRLLLDLLKLKFEKRKSCLKFIVTHDLINTRDNEDVKIISNNLIQLSREKASYQYKCKEFDDKDKLLFCREILGRDEEECAQIIVKNYPGIPGILSNVCYTLLSLERDERIIKLNELSYGSQSNETLNNLVISHYTGLNGEYGDFVETFCKWLILFQNQLPASFVISRNSKKSYLHQMKQEKLIKYNLETNTYSFFQEYYFTVLSRQMTNLNAEAKSILQWIENKTDKFILVKFICLNITEQIDKAFEFGLLVLKQENVDLKIKKNIAETLYLKKCYLQNKQTEYELEKILAHINLFSNNLREGVAFFNRAYKLSTDKNIKLSKKEIYHIRHEYINSLLHSGKYDKALNVLNKIRECDIDLLKYRFLLHNRLGVVNTFLYNVDIAEKNLLTAMQYAMEMNDKFYTSTNYSDLAYLYLKTNQKEKAILYFNKAIEDHKGCGYSELYRDVEINEQKAIFLALNKKYNQANNFIKFALKICECNYRNFSKLKVNYVKAYIAVCCNDFDGAEKLYKNCIALAKIFNSDTQILYSYAGLATLYMFWNKENYVKKLFNKIISFMNKIKFKGLGAKLAIFKNFALWFYKINDETSLSVLKSFNLEKLNSYINLLKIKGDISIDFASKNAQNASNVDGYSFLF